MALLEIGNVVYSKSYNNLSKYKIDRVTETQAIAGEVRFNREYSETSGCVRVKGRTNKWNSTSYYIADAETEIEFEKQRILYKVANYKFDKLNIEALREVKKIMDASPQ